MRLHITGIVSLVPLLLAAASCSYGHSPTAATVPSPLVAQVGGTWSGPLTLQTVSAPEGGTLDCVGAGLTDLLKTTDTATMVITQSGATLSATLTSLSSGLACTYAGTAGPGSMVLNAKSCDAPMVVVRCATGEVHNVQVIGTTVTASVSGGTASGVVASTYNVFSGGSTQIAGLTSTSSLTAVRQ